MQLFFQFNVMSPHKDTSVSKSETELYYLTGARPGCLGSGTKGYVAGEKLDRGHTTYR